MNIKKLNWKEKRDGEKEEKKHSKERLCCGWVQWLVQTSRQASKRRKKENNAKHKERKVEVTLKKNSVKEKKKENHRHPRDRPTNSNFEPEARM
ncbi:uncharacterized protein STEHIDRAFT_125516, partial [Stereum hirsutum FP-91666 SS1]|uniref:uncharacterized protein n=1 Tax=Stereum hirsutum (strain FP-91666) TaxID=721885 RepID=UPI000444A7F1